MSIENIEHPELKKFAKQAEKDNWEIKYKSGMLDLLNHKKLPDIRIRWEKAHKSWCVRTLNDENRRKEEVPVSKLSYPSSLLI